MTRQSFVRILLSLLLLMSQQMATSHVMSHWRTGPAQAQAQTGVQKDRGALLRAMVQDQSCDQCLAFAQLAGPLASHPHGFAFTDPGTTLLAAIAPQTARARSLRAFEPRAPPQA